MGRGASFAIVSLLVLASATSALAQAPSSATVTYDPDFFARFAPRNAYDMVARVPGFTIDEGAERRGLSGASGNVRIDGNQPSAKSQTIEDILTRIPAADVARVELTRGEGSGSGGGQTAFVNVVRTANPSGEISWTIGALSSPDTNPTPELEAALSRGTGLGFLSLRAKFTDERATWVGARSRFNNIGTLTARRDETTPYRNTEGQIGGELKSRAIGGDLSVTAQYQRTDEVRLMTGLTRNSAGLLATDDRLFQGELSDVYEGGFGFGRALGAWTLDLNGLITRTTFTHSESETSRTGAGVFRGASALVQDQNSGEMILRPILKRTIGAAKLEIGVEAALNTLEQQLSLTTDSGAGPVAIVLPSANVRVEEKRAEAYATLVVEPAAGWSIESTIAAETSTLTQKGDVNLDTEFSFFKPSLQIVRSLSGNNQLRARVYRDIGQLNFEDFVAASRVAENTVSAGNPDLRPETSWRAEIAGDWRFGADGALGANVFRWWVTDARDVIPVGPPGAQFAAPGNIGDASVYGMTVSFTLPLGSVLSGAQISGEGTAQQSEVTDPFTAQSRSLSEFQDVFASLSFRQDLPAHFFAWGATYQKPFEVSARVRLDELRTERDDQEWEVFGESTALEGLKLRGWVRRLSGPPTHRTRTFFSPDRRGVFAGSEEQERQRRIGVGLSLSGKF